MPEQSKDEEVRMWLGRIELAKRYQAEFGNVSTNESKGGRWDQNVKALAGDFNSGADLGNDAIDVNMVRSGLRSTLPPLWLNTPHITVRPTKPKTSKDQDAEFAAELNELELNYWFRELGVRQIIRKIVHDGEATNMGYVYLGYVKEKIQVENTDGERTEPIPTIRFKQPFARRISPKNVLFPPGYDEPEECPWMSVVWVLPLSDVKDRYPGNEELEATMSRDKAVNDPRMAAEFQDYLKSEDAKLVEVHNIWDKRTNKVRIMVPAYAKYLEEPEDWPYKTEGFPMAFYNLEYVPDELYGTPPISSYLPQNKELNMTRTSMARRQRKTKKVMLVHPDIQKESIDDYKDAEDNSVVVLQGVEAGERIQDKFHLDLGVPFSRDDLAYDHTIKTDIRELQGLGAERRGGGDPSIGSATASANVEKGTQIREADRGDAVRSVYLQIAKKLRMILLQFKDVKRTRLIAGPLAGEMVQVDYTLRELEGEFDFDMDFGAMLADTPQARVTKATLNYNLLRGDPLIDPNKLILDVLKAQNTTNPQDYMLQLKTPDEEFELMSQGLPVEANDRDDHATHDARHEEQQERVEQMLTQMDQQAIQQGLPSSDTPERRKLALLQALLLAHDQSHAKIVQKLTGQSQQAGKPVAENLLRNQIRAGSSETEAELTGQPLTPEGMVQ